MARVRSCVKILRARSVSEGERENKKTTKQKNSKSKAEFSKNVDIVISHGVLTAVGGPR